MSTYTPPFPNLTNASGMFTLQEVEDAMKNKSWPDLNSRAIIGGGYTPSRSNVIDFVEIASTGNATDFGDLTAAVQSLGAANNKQRGFTYNNYIDLFKVLKKIIKNRDFKNSKNKSLLDKTYSQKFCVSSIIRYIESIK